MDYDHAFEQASDFSRRAMTLMERHGIPAHPNNFTIWYSYCAGEHPDLEKTIDILLENSEAFDEARNTAVYRKFCTSPYEALPLPLIAERMEAELAAVMGTLETANRNAAEYGRTLETVHTKVLCSQRAEEMCMIIARLLQQTRAVAQQSREMEQKLRDSWLQVGQLQEELATARKEATKDPLTGLANRRMFDYALREATVHASEAGETMSLMLLNIDHFKRFNDAYGHDVGDHVIKLLAMVLQDSVKGQDTAARYSGDGFAVVLPRTELADALKLADGIRQRVNAKAMVNRKSGEQLGRISVSAGVAEYVMGEPVRRLVKRADQALYFAKRAGRNRIASELETGELVAFEG